jgi:hypothetical protein
MNNEFLKMQKLAGLITEGEFKAKLNEAMFDDNAKAYGVLFIDNDDEDEIGNVDYIWDEDVYKSLIKSMGYKEEDINSIVNGMTEFFPAGEDEMEIFRAQENNPELEPTDLTIGMYKKNIEKEFEK